ncbi:MAG TPA: hypothetical protein DCE23_00305 [Firmicutes bacterium]|nr:hypothetical protein [Bacillota bacterium]
MKRKAIYILSVILLTILPLKINAFSGSITINCPKNVIGAGEEMTCTMMIKPVDGLIYGASTQISVGNKNLTIVSSTLNKEFKNGSCDGNICDAYDLPKKGNIALGTVTIEASSAINTTTALVLTNSRITMIEDCGTNNCKKEEISVPNSQVNVRIASNNNELNDLQVDGTSILNNLTFSTDKDSATITASAKDQHAKVTGTGHVKVNYGENKFNVNVTAENGSVKTYTITIIRNDNRSSDNNLKELKISKGKINFRENTTTYNVEVDTDVESINIEGVVKDSKSIVTGTGNKSLKLGNNRFHINVTAENGSVKTYTINVNRKDNRSSNNNLKSLTINPGKIDFRSEKTEYEIAVDYEISKITIEATPEDEKSKIEGLEEKELQVGENNFEIKVIAENGSRKTYKLKIIRNIEVVETANNKAKNITIKSHKFNFDPNVTEYTLETRLHELEINVELENPTSKYEIKGNENLHDGSLIQITITDAEGNSNIYAITIYNPNEEKSSNGILDWPIFKTPKYILYITIVVSIIIIIILLVLVSKEKNNLKKMLSKKHHHMEESNELNTDYNNPLLGEPTYETLEMAKIDLEDYLSEERKAKRRKGIKESEEDIKTLRDELEEKIAILEDAENALEDIKNDTENKKNKKSKEKLTKAAEDLEVTAINIETIMDKDLEDYDEEAIKPKETRSSKRASKKIDLIGVEEMLSEPEMKDDIDDLINASTISKNSEVKETRSSKNKKAKEIKEEVEKESPKTSEEPKSTSKKKKSKKKKNSTTTSKKSNDDLLDQILSNNYKK